MFKNLTNEFNKLDECQKTKGYFTKSDIFSLNFSSFFKNAIVFVLKRSSEFSYHYICKNKKYEYLHDIKKEDRNLAETYFTRRD